MLGNRATVELLRAGQAKLAVGHALDASEAEADAVAHAVVQRLAGSSRPPVPGFGDAPEREGISRGVAGTLSRAAEVGHAGGAVSPETEAAISDSRRGGAPLPAVLRTTMESAFDADFSKVRVHADERAADLNDTVAAKAFTIGNDIFFRDGLPSTTTQAGQHLLAHELTHTLQQGAARSQATAEPLATRSHETERTPERLQRYPATAFATPVDWKDTTGSVVRPSGGLSGGIFILTTSERPAEVDKVVVKPVYGGERGETGESLQFGDRILATMGINTPVSRVVKPGTKEYSQLMGLLRPEQMSREEANRLNEEGQPVNWHDVGEAGSFVVMGMVPNASSVGSLAESSVTDERTRSNFFATILSRKFLAELGMLSVGDYLVGNTDRLLMGKRNLGNLMISKQDGGPELFAIDTGVETNLESSLQSFKDRGSTSGGFNESAQDDLATPTSILDGFFQTLSWKLQGTPEQGQQGGEAQKLFDELITKNRDRLHADFMSGWNRGVMEVRELLQKDEDTGRSRLKDLTGEYKNTEGARTVKHSVLKAHAMYLIGKHEGKSHEEAVVDPAAYYAYQRLLAVDTNDLFLPRDEASPRTATFHKGSENAEVLPGLFSKFNWMFKQISPKQDRFVEKQFADALETAAEARQAADGLGTKRSGPFGKKVPRNRTVATRYVADLYVQVAGAARHGSHRAKLEDVVQNLDAMLDGHLSKHQIAKVLPIAERVPAAVQQFAEMSAQYQAALEAGVTGLGRMAKVNPVLPSSLAETLDLYRRTRVQESSRRPGFDEQSIKAMIQTFRAYSRSK